MEWVRVWEAHTDALSGPEWMAAVCAPAEALKRQLVMLEQQHPLGRLWD
jgi:holo-ACP synthase